jgi:hypothetical protein
VAAKRSFFAEGCLPWAVKWEWVRTAGTHFLATVGTVSLGFMGLLLSSRGRAGLAWSAILLAAYFIGFPGALGHYEHRYLYPTLVLAIFGLAEMMASRTRALRVTALLAAGFALVESASLLTDRLHGHARQVEVTSAEFEKLTAWLAANFPPGAPILLHDAGYLGAHTGFTLVDIVGLKTPSSVRAHEQYTEPSCGRDRNKALAAIYRATSPSAVVVLPGWDRIFDLMGGLAKEGIICDRTYPPSGKAMYSVYQCGPHHQADRGREYRR